MAVIAKICKPAQQWDNPDEPMRASDAIPQHSQALAVPNLPPPLSALPVRSQKIAIAVVAPNYQNGPGDRLASAKARFQDKLIF